jgi:hypothetical protein
MWVGLFAAPAAWALLHVSGVELQFATCHDNTVGPSSGVNVDAVTLVVTIAAAAVAVLGGLAAVGAWRATRAAEDDDAPPAGRIHFLAVIGMTTTPLFLALILMAGLGEVFLPSCVQS